jgi:hypothetical protein
MVGTARTRQAPRHWVDPDPSRTLDGTPLAPWQRDLAAIAEAMFATEAGAPPPERVEWLVRQMADFLRRAGLRTRFVLKSSIAAVTHGAPLLAGQRGPFRALPLAARLHGLEKAERSPLGLACFAVKAMTCILWFEHPDSAAEIGFDGGCAADTQRANPVEVP